MDRRELKSIAKNQIKGKIAMLFLTTLMVTGIVFVANLVLSFIPVVGSLVASIVLTPAFSLGLLRMYLTVANNGEPKVAEVFSGFDDFWSAFKTTFLVGLFTILWTLLLIIPGIVKKYSYSMALYILAENKGKSARECIKESMAMTEGHKMELFVLDLSLIGWMILGSFTFGIAYIWIIPYVSTLYANVYNSLKPEVVVETVATEVE